MSDIRPTLSVVIPLYNKAAHIGATLQSVLAQTSLPLEIIVVDDGSTDGGAEAAMQFPGVRVLKQPNRGVSAARNTGVWATNAKYVAFLDADDIWYPSHLAMLARLIQTYPDCGLFSTAHEIRQDNRTLRPASPYGRGAVVRVEDFFLAMAKGLTLVNSTTACVRREALLAIGGFPEGVHRGEDIIVWAKIACAFGMAHANVVTAVYNRDACNRSHRIYDPAVPASVVYLGSLFAKGYAQQPARSSVARLHDAIALYTAAGLRADHPRASLRHYRRHALEQRRWRLLAVLWVLSLLPSVILRCVRRFRHNKEG